VFMRHARCALPPPPERKVSQQAFASTPRQRRTGAAEVLREASCCYARHRTERGNRHARQPLARRCVLLQAMR